jgi:hypothetical protein
MPDGNPTDAELQTPDDNWPAIMKSSLPTGRFFGRISQKGRIKSGAVVQICGPAAEFWPILN